MATIPQYTAKKLLSPDGALDTTVHDFVGGALEKLGGTVADVGAQLQQRIDQRNDFKDQNNYRKLQLDLNSDLADQSTNAMPEGGIGFHDNFMSTIYSKRRDEFLKTVSPKNRDKFATLLSDKTGADFGEWSNKAANTERDATQGWAKDQVAVTSDQLASAIAINPEEYDQRLKEGNDLIDSMPMTDALTKRQLKRNWENMAQVAHLNAVMETNPEDVLKLLGANPNHLSPTTQFDLLAKAVTAQESGGNPNAVSSAGAIGKMQVMPDTARFIAEKLIKDPNFPRAGKGLAPEELQNAIASYLKDPTTNVRYGQAYLHYLLGKYPGDLEAALVAYHSGPARADEWVKSGRDDSVLGPVGRKYYKEVIARMPGMTAGNEGDVQANLPPISDANVFLRKRINLSGRMEGVKAIDNLHPEMQTRLAAMIMAAPPEIQKGLGLFSGWRSKEHQQILFNQSDKTGRTVAHPGKSNHESGAAADLAFNGQSLAKAPPEVVDWVHKNAARFGLKFPLSYEPWHVEMSETRGGGKMTVADRYATLPYDKRQQFVNAADTAVTQRVTQARQQDAITRVEVQSAMQDELALITKTGHGSNTFDDTAVQASLGDSAYMKWVEDRQDAQKMYTATQGIETMSPQDMQDRINDFTPNPASPDYATQVKAYDAVVRKADEITRERASQPDKAAMRFPDVQEAYAKVQAQLATGEPDPGDMQAFIRTMIAHQQDFGVSKKATAPVPRAMALAIGKQLSTIPDPSKTTKMADVRASIAAQYMTLEKVFGDYTDEVVLYALTEYKGLNPATAKVITSMMTSIAHGGDPFKPAIDPEDQQQTESTSWYQSLGNYIFGGGDPEAAPQNADPNAPASPELILRAKRRLEEGTGTPEEIGLLTEQYGAAAVKAAQQAISTEDSGQ